MDARFVLFLLFCFMKTFDDADGVCILDLKTDFGQSSAPVLLRNKQYLTPNAGSSVRLLRNQRITVACPGSKKTVILGSYKLEYDTVEARCISNTTFQVDSWTGLLKEIRCSTPPWYTTEPVDDVRRDCGVLYRVGYRVKDVFYELYQACFNKDLLKTVYVKHKLNPSSHLSQPGPRPKFNEGSLFGRLKMDKMYNSSNQKTVLNSLLGAEMDQKYLNKNQFLTRGHLAARADFPLRAMQRASFHYVNTAPQWRRGNAGDWAALEEAIRRRVKDLNTTVIVYTGTEGVTTLKNNNDQDTEIYLSVDGNNNGIVPVPMYFYKLVYDPKTKAASAFVTINSSYHDKNATDSLTFCDDICQDNPNFSWLTWRSSDGTHSFCCDYQEFARKITYLPKLNVGRMFY